MAVTFVAATSAQSAGASSLTITKPAGLAVGDVMVAVVADAYGGGSGYATPAEWTYVGQRLATAGNSPSMAVYWRVATASEAASWTWTGAFSNYMGAILAYRGVDPTTPVGTLASQAATSLMITAPSVTPTKAPTVVVAPMVHQDSPVPATPSGLTLRASSPSNANLSRLAVFDFSQASTSPTGSKTSTGTNTTANIGQQIALVPANNAPNAPTLVGPIGDQVIDRADDLVLDHEFSDPDPGDSQSARETRWRPIGAAEWTSTGKVASVVTAHTIPGGTLAAGPHEWQAKTWDAQGLEGPWSGSEFFTAADRPPLPTITSGVAEGGTVSAESYVETWSAPVQDSAEWQVLADNAGVADPSTVIASGTVGATARSVEVPYPDNNTARHFRVRVEDDGLFSDYASRRRLVSFTAPPVPTVTLTTNDTAGSISALIGSPAPAAGEPSVVSYDLFRRLSADGGDGIRIAAGVAAGTVVDFTPASGVEHDYRVKALGDNGTSSLSPWTDDATPEPIDPGGSGAGGYSGGY